MFSQTQYCSQDMAHESQTTWHFILWDLKCFVFSKSESYRFEMIFLSELFYNIDVVTDGSWWFNRKIKRRRCAWRVYRHRQLGWSICIETHDFEWYLMCQMFVVYISMRSSFFHIIKYSLIQPVTLINYRVLKLTSEGEPAAAPLTDEEQMLKYWRILKYNRK